MFIADTFTWISIICPAVIVRSFLPKDMGDFCRKPLLKPANAKENDNPNFAGQNIGI